MSHAVTLAALEKSLDTAICNYHGESPLNFSGIAINSTAVTAGTLFIAVTGALRDGHEFVSDAYARGAIAAVVARKEVLAGRPGLVVHDTRLAASKIAALWYGEPSRQQSLVAITGTNGKTTTNWILHHLFLSVYGSSIRAGTLGVRAQNGNKTILDRPGDITTPDPLSNHEALRLALDAGITHGVFEASSHALDQRRVDNVYFDVGIFTNLTRDHLDYHKDMESYYRAKCRLFELIGCSPKKRKVAVINIDDPFGKRMVLETNTQLLEHLTFGFDAAAAVCIEKFEQGLTSSDLVIRHAGRRIAFTCGLIGRHNASNLAAAYGAAVALGVPEEKIISAFATLPQVPGRLQVVPAKEFGIYVDYAHTPDALENVARTLRDVVKGKLWIVFGCGGDRDRGKRPQMASVARRYGDKVVVTSDNPRTEDPKSIIDDILSAHVKVDIVEADRQQAIAATIQALAPGDVVLIAGKGHEDYQIIGTEKHHFSDFEEAAKALAARCEARHDSVI